MRQPLRPLSFFTSAGRGLFPDLEDKVRIVPGQAQSIAKTLTLAGNIAPGRHVFPVVVSDSTGREPVDTFFAIEIEK